MRYIIAMLDNVYQEVQEYALESEDKEKVLEKTGFFDENYNINVNNEEVL